MRDYDIPINPNSRPTPVNTGLKLPITRLALLAVCVGMLAALYQQRQTAGAIFGPRLLPTANALVPTAPPLRLTVVPVPSTAPDFQAILVRANDVFRSARARADAADMTRVSTGAWLAYEREYAAELRSRNATERWALTAFAITSTVHHGDSAVICTTEKWDRAVLLSDGTLTQLDPLNLIERYTLVQDGASWLVSEIQYPASGCIS